MEVSMTRIATPTLLSDAKRRLEKTSETGDRLDKVNAYIEMGCGDPQAGVDPWVEAEARVLCNKILGTS